MRTGPPARSANTIGTRSNNATGALRLWSHMSSLGVEPRKSYGIHASTMKTAVAASHHAQAGRPSRCSTRSSAGESVDAALNVARSIPPASVGNAGGRTRNGAGSERKYMNQLVTNPVVTRNAHPHTSVTNADPRRESTRIRAAHSGAKT